MNTDVLILVVVEDVLVQAVKAINEKGFQVLILVVVEDVLVRLHRLWLSLTSRSLNPCCSGRCSSTH